MDSDALAAIFDTDAPMVFSYGFRLCQNAVETDELVGEVFSRRLENFSAGRMRVINLRSYIFQIGYQSMLERLRDDHQPISSQISKKRTEQRSSTTAHTAVETERLLVLNTDLTAIERQVILLRYLEKFNLEETAPDRGKERESCKRDSNPSVGKFQSETFRATDSKNVLSGFDV